MSAERPKVLVIGYGNPGRRDDGLGPALAEALEKLRLPRVTVEADYQLTVEDAVAVAEHDVAIFADADLAGAGPFYFRRIEPHAAASFTSHLLAPAAVLQLARELFGAGTKGYILGIRGYEFDEFGEEISARAAGNLAAALAFMHAALGKGEFNEVGDPPAPRASAVSATAKGN